MDHIFASYDWKKTRTPNPYRYCPVCGAELKETSVQEHLRLTCECCGFIHFRNPTPAVSILVVEDGKVLLGKRQSELENGKWALPSGYIEYEEDFISAGVREIKEETGLEARMEAILHVESGFLTPDYHVLTVYLFGRVTGGELQQGDDLSRAGWFPMDGLPDEMAFPSDRRLIELYAGGKLQGLKIQPGERNGD